MITATATLTETISVTASLGGSVCLSATYTLVDTDVPPNTLDSGSIASGAAETIVAPAASVTVNTSPFGTAPSGGGLNVPVVNGGANQVGSKQGSDWVIENNATFINGTQVTDQEAEVDANIFVTLDGTQSGTWNAGTQTWEVTSAASGSVSVTVSDATPNFGDTITITATPTGITPTSYLFFAFDGTDITFIAEQAGAVVNWDISVLGAFQIYVAGTDGTTEVFDTQSVTSTGDADAMAYIVAAGLTDPTIVVAVNSLFIEIKDGGFYSKIKAMYLYLGGTAASCKWNAVNPLDTNAAFRQTYSGGVSFNAMGVDFNGVNGYSRTYLTPSTHLAADSMHIAFYTSLNIDTGADQGDMGVVSGANALFISSKYNSGAFVNRFLARNSSTSVLADTLNTDATGFYIANKTANGAGTFKTWKNGTIQDTDTGDGSNPTLEGYIGAVNIGGAPAIYSNRPHSFSSYGDGLTDVEVVAYSSAVNTFLVNVSRK